MAARTGVPVGQLRSLIGGRSALGSTIESIAAALDLEFYIGPPRSPPDLDSEPRIPDANPPASTAESSPPYGAALPAMQLRDLEGHIHALVRSFADVVGGPIPPDVREALIWSEGWAAQEPKDNAFDLVRHYDVRLAAGTGEAGDQEAVVGYVAFRREWLRDHRLRANNLRLVEVIGDSMEPTLHAGDLALLDHSRRQPRSGHIFALRTEDGLIVKRLRRERGWWWADSDNADYEPRGAGKTVAVIGRVVWWAHTERR